METLEHAPTANAPEPPGARLPRDYLDRFSGLGRLYGADALPALSRARVAVIGIGGVGSWTAEALARSGVGTLDLVDLDDICVTNVNRQLHALQNEIGRSKVEVMAGRIRQIHPGCEVRALAEYFTPANAERLLAPGYDCIVDAIDTVDQKAALVAACRERGLPLVVSGGAGGKSDPTRLATADLAFATNDRLLKLLRKKLRREHGFPSEASGQPFGVPCVHSRENARYPWRDGTVRDEAEPGSHLRLNCDEGFGTAAPVTGAFGLAAAAEAIRVILGKATG